MLKRRLLTALLLATVLFAFGQTDAEVGKTHYISIQTNPLISQILNFGNPAPVDNPYLLKYSCRGEEKSSALAFGLGFSTNSFDDEKGSTSESVNLNLRTGYEWFIPVGDHFEMSLGPDLIFDGTNISTQNIQSFDFGGSIDSTVNKTSTQRIGYGGGARLNFSVFISPKIMIGTEATFYYRLSNFKTLTAVANFQDFGGQQVTSYEEETQKAKSSNATIHLPVAIYLTFRL